jgi:hypothetical protein
MFQRLQNPAERDTKGVLAHLFLGCRLSWLIFNGHGTSGRPVGAMVVGFVCDRAK